MTSERGRVELSGVIVRVVNFGEADRIIELLTAEQGRVSLVARGGRVSKRRFGGALDLFESLRVQAQPRGSLWSLLAADVLAARVGIRHALAHLARAALLVEVGRRLTNEQEPAPLIHEALAWGLDRLAAAAPHEAALAYSRMLVGAGIGPDLARCGRCGRSRPSEFRLDRCNGHLLCGSCAAGPRLRAELLAWPPGLSPESGEADLLEADLLAWIEQETGKPLAARWLALTP